MSSSEPSLNNGRHQFCNFAVNRGIYGLQKHSAADDITDMTRKWQSEEEMNAELRRIADDTRRLRDEMRAYLPQAPKPRRTPELPTDEDRRLRPLDAVEE